MDIVIILHAITVSRNIVTVLRLTQKKNSKFYVKPICKKENYKKIMYPTKKTKIIFLYTYANKKTSKYLKVDYHTINTPPKFGNYYYILVAKAGLNRSWYLMTLALIRHSTMNVP